jgi:hypothetical protein
MSIKFTLFFADLTYEVQEEKITEYITNKFNNREYKELELEDGPILTLQDLIIDEEYRIEARASIERSFPINI